MMEYSLFAIFLTGLLGGTHCVGMCGGIVAAISMQLPGQGTRFSYHFAYNAGRILSYAVAGGVAGAVGASALLLEGLWPVQQALYVLANLMLLALGLYLAGLWQAVTQIERLGGLLWRRLQPFSKSLLPVRNPLQAFLLGTLWGWLPCGLVYSVLITALASGSAISGAAAMLAFGLGTLPNLIAMGLFAQQLQALTRNIWVRRASGLLVAGYGAWGLLRLALG
ncbi:MAG: sulfite exporter TauE/SafE family protein [Sulfurimicrobium sp.]|nr:sulfite exporter TauE/SafE family protein [Sulfurimicrobium sp.]MDP1705153.1 sulfite exporter TauE/SafE family protein [Sulfurimicrobium sp.]MDP2197484.1 sulfite exporter TauE/SafE family protein [Sulfurimicrobium sp.]MDP3685953.1 sulfite exporter TauE/SafE family protein [Sulfurimicrobium sp.]